MNQVPEDLDQLTPMGRQIYKKFGVLPIDILREDWTCTIDWGREMSKSHRQILERRGIEVVPEEGSIYTLSFTYEG